MPVSRATSQPLSTFQTDCTFPSQTRRKPQLAARSIREPQLAARSSPRPSPRQASTSSRQSKLEVLRSAGPRVQFASAIEPFILSESSEAVATRITTPNQNERAGEMTRQPFEYTRLCESGWMGEGEGWSGHQPALPRLLRYSAWRPPVNRPSFLFRLSTTWLQNAREIKGVRRNQRGQASLIRYRHGVGWGFPGLERRSDATTPTS
jgi:hypothetical protein